jgi:hypothetical protein
VYMGAMRHRNPMLCTMGALAQYLFWRWHMSSELAPNFKRKQDWYRLKVLVGACPTEELAYTTQYNSCFEALCRAGISAESITHIMRKKGAQEAERLGVPDPQVS